MGAKFDAYHIQFFKDSLYSIALHEHNYHEFIKEINKISGSNFGDFDSKSEQNMVAHQNTQ